MLILLTVYYLVPGKHQWKVLLAASLCFYVFAKPVYIIFILTSIAVTWYLMRKPTRARLIWTIVINLGILIVFRYSVYFGIHDLLVPLGMSFYTFMTLGYALDCYDRKIEPCDNLFHYALFISYFPQITEGPIGTYQDMKDRLIAVHRFDRDNIIKGGYRVIQGLFKKLVIAGRLSYYVDTVYGNPKAYGGLTLIAATFFYAIELYADFSGYMDIACGISGMLGIKLKENFMRPYFSKNVPEYWRRWHISLNEWFSTHLFMPAVTSGWNKKISKVMYKIFPKAKKGTIRMIFPMIIVWITTGIWHGAEAVYVAWGVYFAVIMLLSVCTAAWVKSFSEKIHWKADRLYARIFQTVRTFVIVCLGEVLFRSETLSDAFHVYKGIFTDTRINAASVIGALTPFGNGNQAAASVIIIALLIGGLFVTELMAEHNEKAFMKHRCVYAGVLMVVTVLFGVAGQSSFMYQAF